MHRPRTHLAICLAAIAFFIAFVEPAVAEDVSPRDAWTTSRLDGRPSPPLPYKVVLAFPNLQFSNPTCVATIPGTDQLLVSHAGGLIVGFPQPADASETWQIGDLSELSGGDVSITHVAFHPRFLQNRFMYVCHRHHEGGPHMRVSRYTLTRAEQVTVIAGSEQFILRWPAGGHGGGCLQFGTDGFLYISTGDGSGPSPPDGLTTGQDVTDLLGAVLRVDVDGRDGQTNYRIPDDNPLLDVPGARAEIWSYGLRNPWKFGIDRVSGQIFVADNGWETWEMIHRLHAGSNCGWPIMEGRARLRTEVKPGPTPITPPIIDHPHTEANSVIGGPIYRGAALTDLQGTFVYGDYITGTVWGLKVDAAGDTQHRTLADSELHIVALAEGSGGEIYLLDYDRTGQLYQLIPSDEPDTSGEFPRRLSQTGLFEETAALQPAPGVQPYAIVAEPWDDGARAQRWIALPGSTSVHLDASDPTLSQFPEGTVFVKHLSLGTPQRPLETQVLHYHRGTWNPYSYLWNEAGDDAELVDVGGTDHEVQLGADEDSLRTWHVGAENECRLCHNTASGPILGFTARQLDRPISTSVSVSQWDSLTSLRVLTQRPELPAGMQRFASPHDPTADMNDRSRSYLHINCGVCHNRAGPATISFYAHYDYPFSQLRITKRPGIGMFGMHHPRLVAGGDPYRSTILYRISKLGYGRMPYVGSRVVDSQGVGLLDRWIRSLTTGHDPADEAVAALPAAELISRLDRREDLSLEDVEQLLQCTEGALALSTAMHRGQLAAENVQQVHDKISQLDGDKRGLFEDFLPESKRRRSLGAKPDPQLVLSRTGDAARGKLIFVSDDARCRSCHDAHDPARSVGPTLADIRGKYKQPAELLQQILEPSAKIDDKFATWVVATQDGQVVAGLLRERGEGTVALQLADKRIVRFEQSTVDSLMRSDRSVMPDGVLSDLTPQEAADLLSYLLTPE